MDIFSLFWINFMAVPAAYLSHDLWIFSLPVRYFILQLCFIIQLKIVQKKSKNGIIVLKYTFLTLWPLAVPCVWGCLSLRGPSAFIVSCLIHRQPEDLWLWLCDDVPPPWHAASAGDVLRDRAVRGARGDGQVCVQRRAGRLVVLRHRPRRSPRRRYVSCVPVLRAPHGSV